jgi:biotin carboxyl carrier protein
VSGAVRSPAVGRVVELLVVVGDRVAPGQDVAVVESMKVEIPVAAGVAGVVRTVAVEVGTQVQAGALLLVVEP